MGSDPIRGKTIRWTYDDGPMKGKTFEHRFAEDGTVTWKEAGGAAPAPKPPTNGSTKKGKASEDSKAKYEAIPINDDVYAVSYLAGSGYTLTSILDFDSGTVVGFASNEKDLGPLRGKFEVAERVT